MATTTQTSQVLVRRGFADSRYGQIHYREAGQRREDTPTLLLIHASPGSALTLEPLLREFGKTRHVIATDTLGNGDSAAPSGDTVSISELASAHLDAMDSLGISHVDLYGTHTGASIASEIAISDPQRVHSLILDGIGLYAQQEQAELLEHYVPNVHIDQNGSQFPLIWSFVRDAYLFWPWYKKDTAHRRPAGLPSADILHDKTVEVLKAARSFHLPYRAALGHDKRSRLPLITVPTLLTCAAHDMLYEYLEAVHALIPHARCSTHDGIGSSDSLTRTVALFQEHFAHA